MTEEAATRVACFSGHTYAQRPVAFVWQGQRLAVSEIEAEWHTPEGKIFRIISVDGRKFELSYAPETDEWRVEIR